MAIPDPKNVAAYPVAIGGVGGSGTRLIAQIVGQLGYYLGGDLNGPRDNLWVTLLLKRTDLLACDQREFDQAIGILTAAMTGAGLTQEQRAYVRRAAGIVRPMHDLAWLQLRAESLLRVAQVRRDAAPWAWKEPNTHVFLDRLNASLPGMKYIHVMRHGLDMAYSSNQNQLKLWGSHFLDGAAYQVTPRWSLKYWCVVHRRIVQVGAQMPGRFLLLNYDLFVTQPRAGLRKLLEFLGSSPDPDSAEPLLALVQKPDSIGRFKHGSVAEFDAEDVAFAESLGFGA